MSIENIKQGSVITDKVSLLLRNGENEKALDLLGQNYGPLARNAMEKVMKYSNLSQDEMVRVFGKISDILENVADKISRHERLNEKKEKAAAAREQAEDAAELAAIQAEAMERRKKFEDRMRWVEEQKQKLAEERRQLEEQRRFEKDARKRREIEEKLNATAAERDKVFNDFTAPIRTQLDKMGLKYRILARVKSIYSIWNKMQTKHVPFEEIYDLLAVRIIFEPRNVEEELNDCFDIYVSISKIYKPHPDRLRDWVSHPKANGYQALHVTLMGNNGQWIEVQIRSERMNDVAEQGFAAHWKYKEGGGSEDEGELEKWLKTIKEILDDPQPDAIDFLDTIKLNLFASEIFVFTPKGELKTMPQNSTALDFAFSLHTDIGSHCIGAKVNHKLVPLSHKLQSGDQVEILTSKSQRVQPQWEVFATTARARAKIAAILRKERKANQKIGEELLNEFLKKEEIRPEEAVIEKLRKFHNFKNEEELLAAIGSKAITLGEADKNELREKQTSNWKKYLTFSFGNSNKEKPEEKEPQEKEKINPKEILKLTEESLQKKYIMAECCHPIPGDDVLGYVDENDRIIIHKRQCPVAAKLKSSYGNRILATEWDTHKELSFLVYIYLRGIDSMGLLNEVTQVISRQLNVNIRKLAIETNDGIFEGKIQLWVHDVEDVKTICNNLKKIQNIKQVNRVEE